jgi:hypothetical protein
MATQATALAPPTPVLSPRTVALQRALQMMRDVASAADLLFLEAWEAQPTPQIGTALRVHQIRRANPLLAAEIRAELSRGRPLTVAERDALSLPPPRVKPRL